ncbi:unnamed protein product, partial [Schistosoma spindalis]
MYSLKPDTINFKKNYEQRKTILNPIDNSFEKLNNCLYEYQQYNCFTKHEHTTNTTTTNINDNNNNNDNTYHHQSSSSSSSSLYSELLKYPLTNSVITYSFPIKSSSSNELNKLNEQQNSIYCLNNTQNVIDSSIKKR